MSKRVIIKERPSSKSPVSPLPPYSELMGLICDVPVFVQITQSRAGSDLLHSLLDSHAEILQQPGSFNFPQFWNSRRYPENPLFSAWELVTAGEENKTQISKFDSRLNEYENWQNLGEGAASHFEVSVIEFVGHLHEILKIRPHCSSDDFFRAFHIAYGLASGFDFSRTRIIFFDLHTPEALADFKGLVSVEGVVYCRRHPAGSISSQIGFDLNELEIGRRLPGSLSSTYLRKRQGATRQTGSSGNERTKKIWLEQLHSHAHAVMNDLADFLQISPSASLFESTWRGLCWWGDSQSGGSLRGLNPTRAARLLEKFLEHHSRLEVSALEELVGRDELPVALQTVGQRARGLIVISNLLPTRLEKKILRVELKASTAIGYVFKLRIIVASILFYFWRISEETRRLLQKGKRSSFGA